MTASTMPTLELPEAPAPAPAKPVALPRPDDLILDSKIVIVDDVRVNVRVLRAHLEEAGYSEFVCLTDSTEAIPTIRREQPDLLLLDIMMPEVSGLDILREIRDDAALSRLPVLILTSAESRELKSEALESGATDFLSKPVQVDELLPRVRNALVMKHYEDDLKAQVDQRTAELVRSQQEIIHCLARAAEYRDNETGRHIIRVGLYAGVIADQLGLDAETVGMLRQAATLHDVGKIGIPDKVLLKPGKLTPEEVEIIQKHTGYGGKVFDRVSPVESSLLSDHTALGGQILEICASPIIRMARTIAMTHHERWDGDGYPLGLAGEDIPIEGRITAVADVFDALRTKRPYKPAFPLDKCLSIILEERGRQLDPVVVDAFFQRKDDIVEIQLEHADVC